MEPEDEQSALCPSLASSWDAACGVLDRSLRVPGDGLGAQDSDWDELLAPPAPGQELVILKRSPKSPDESPCFLSLSCGPRGGEEIVSVGLLSSARNVEVYVGEEYCGTSRGRSVCNVLHPSEHEKILLYKNYLRLESAAHACKMKLLSFGEKQCVLVSKVVVHVSPRAAGSPANPRARGSRVDLERVRALVEAVGSPLSPGAQQLMSLVRFQQQGCVPVGERLCALLGNASSRVLSLQTSPPSGACGRSASAPGPLRAGLTSEQAAGDVTAPGDGGAQPPGGGSTTRLGEGETVPRNHSLPGRDLRLTLSSFSPKRASDAPGAPGPELLPLLQSVCGQLGRLRVAQSSVEPGLGAKPSEGVLGVGVGEQPVCSYLEKMLAQQLELLERRLRAHVDEQLCELREHLDRKVAVLAGLLQRPRSPPAGAPLRHCDSGDRLSNGER